jgi:hypothetical protein
MTARWGGGILAALPDESAGDSDKLGKDMTGGICKLLLM